MPPEGAAPQLWVSDSASPRSVPGRGSLWGRGAIARFDGREGNLALDGEVTTGLLGSDWASGPGPGSGAGSAAGRWMAGFALGHSTGTGGYRRGGCAPSEAQPEPNCGGKIEATLTGVYPYAGAWLSDRLSVWFAAGHGAGAVTVRPDRRAALKADLTMTMGADGMRSEVLKPADGDGLALAVNRGSARASSFCRRSSSPGSKARRVSPASDSPSPLRTMARAGSGCLRGWNQSSRKVEKTTV